MGEKGLDKEGLIEVSNMLDTKFSEHERWLSDRFVCKIHCGQKRGNYNVKFVIIFLLLTVALGERAISLLKLIGWV